MCVCERERERERESVCLVWVRVCVYVCVCAQLSLDRINALIRGPVGRGGGLGSRPKKMYGERLGDGVEYHSLKPTPRR